MEIIKNQELLKSKLSNNPFYSLPKAIYEIILENIITFKYAPDTRLVESQLAKDFGISRTPIRKAIQILEEQGFVRKQKNTNIIVAPLETKEYDDLINFRYILEPAAAGFASTLMSEEDFKLLKEYADQLSQAFLDNNSLQILKYEILFHELIVQCSHNLYIIKSYKNIQPYITRGRAAYIITHEDIDPILFSQEHYLIYNALRLRNKEIAEDVVRHLLWALLPTSNNSKQIDISNYHSILKQENDLMSEIKPNY